jgi:hypothetical protein
MPGLTERSSSAYERIHEIGQGAIEPIAFDFDALDDAIGP